MAHVLLIPLTALRCRQAEPWRRPIQSFRTRLCLNATNLLYFTRYFGDDQQIQRHWEAVLKIYQAQMWFMQVVVQSGPVLACILFCSFKTFPFKASSCSLPTARWLHAAALSQWHLPGPGVLSGRAAGRAGGLPAGRHRVRHGANPSTCARHGLWFQRSFWWRDREARVSHQFVSLICSKILIAVQQNQQVFF